VDTFLSLFGGLLPYLAVGLLLLALLVFVVVVLLARQAARKADDAPEQADAAAEPPAGEAAGVEGGARRLQEVFRLAMQRMDRGTRRAEYRYRTPWVLLLGEPGSGKTALLAGARAAGLPAEVIPEQGDLDGQPCDAAWWLFDTGAVLDVRGHLFAGEDRGREDGGRWRRLLLLLQHARPARPADAILLTLPAGDFVGPDRLSDSALERKAERLYRELAELQRQLEIRLPIYLAITQADAIPGFAGFAQAVGPEARRQLLGWSSPYGGEQPYGADWIAEAFQHVRQDLGRTRLRVMAQADGDRSMGDLFRFPQALQQLEAGVARMVDGLLKPSVYHEAFVLRGLYLAGAPERQGDADAEAAGPPAAPVFVHDLLAHRLFAESGLAQPARASFLARNRAQRSLQLASLAAVLLAGVGLLAAAHGLRQDGLRLATALDGVVASMKEQKSVGLAEQTFHREDAEALLNAFTIADDGALSSWLLPAAWLSNLDSRTTAFLSTATQTIVFDATLMELQREADRLASAPPTPDAAPEAFSRIAELPAFQQFDRTVGQIERLSVNAQRYDRLRRHNDSSLQDFRGLVSDLFNRADAARQLDKGAVFADALAQAEGTAFELEADYGERLRGQVRESAQSVHRQLFAARPLVAQLDALDDALADLLQGERQGDRAITAPERYLAALETLRADLGDPAYAWLAEQAPDFGPAYNATAETIARTAVLGTDLRDTIRQEGLAALEEYRSQLFNRYARSPLAPYLVHTDENFEIAPSLGALGGMVRDLVRSDLPGQRDHARLVTQVGENQRVIWNAELLERAAGFFRSYEAFAARAYPDVPAVVRARVREVAAGIAERAMLDAAAHAQTVEARGTDLFGPNAATAIEREVRSFAQASEELQRLLALFGESGFERGRPALRGAVVSQAGHLLQAVDGLLSRDGPLYAVAGPASWDGATPLAYALFGVEGDSGLDLYLAQQRRRLRLLAKGYAEPTVDFLEALAQPAPGLAPTIGRWREGIQAIDRYDAKAPDNAIQRIEGYVRNTMAGLTSDACGDVLAAGPPSGFDDGLLTSRLEALQRASYSACAQQIDDRLFDVYAQVAAAFRPLAGQYPFAAPPAGGRPANAADPAVVRGFFQTFDTAAAGISGGLETLRADRTTRRGRAIGFLQELNRMRAVIDPLLDIAGVGTPQAVRVQVAFRVNAEREVLAYNVLEWRLRLGSQSLSSLGDASSATWSAGQDARLTLHWAADAPSQPIDTAGGPRIDLPEIGYRYPAPWGVLALIQAHQSAPSDLPGNADLAPSTLKFEVEVAAQPPRNRDGETPRPTASARAETARAFLRMQLFPANAEPGKAEPIEVPARFPARLPDIGSPDLGDADRASSERRS
jgi:type VI secretion system protein ImpL